MKELNIHLKPEVLVETVRQVPKKKKFIGTIRPKPGQHLYELNLRTKTIELADIKVTVNMVGPAKREVIIKEDCMYEVALNIQNAERKFLKRVKDLVHG